MSSRPCQARHIAALDRIVLDGQDDDRDGAAGADHRLQADFRSGDHDQIGLRTHQFRGGHEGPARIGRIAIFDGEILTVAEALLAQLGQEGMVVVRLRFEARAGGGKAIRTGRPACCARAASGRPAAAPPRRVMNWRRLIGQIPSNKMGQMPTGVRERELINTQPLPEASRMFRVSLLSIQGKP